MPTSNSSSLGVWCWLLLSYNGQFNHFWQTTDKLVLVVVAGRCWQGAGSQHCRYLQVSGPVCGPSPASNKQLYWYCLWLCPHNLPASHVPARLGSGQLFSSCYKLYCCYLSVSSSVVIKQSSLHINWFVRQNSWYKQLLWQYFKENVKSEKNIDTAGVNLLIWY